MRHNSILITGGAGFVGSNLAVSFRKKYPSLKVAVLDNLKRRGSELNLARLKEHGIAFHHGDIRCPEDFPALEFDAMIECSAEPSVLAGFGESPLYLINTNLTGTINCLEQVRKRQADVIFISTSRVYPYQAINAIPVREDETRLCWETPADPLRGWSPEGIAVDFPLEGARSLYGASKLCSELLLQEYLSMYGIRGVINRCGVIAGPWQFGKVDQGVFTLWMLAHHFKRANLSYIGYGGTGKQVRDLLHVDDLFELIDLELAGIERFTGSVFNAGGGEEVSLSLMETTALCREITGNTVPLGSVAETRPADLKIYLTDNRHVREATGWAPRRSARTVLEDIERWIVEREEEIERVL